MTLRAACSIPLAPRNCPFLILTILPVRAAAAMRSVWRQRKAGIWRTSTYSAAIAASWVSCMSVTTGQPNSSLTLASILSALISPMPVNESTRERLALRYEPLKMYGIFRRSVILATRSAMCRATCSSSIQQGPAIRKKLGPAVRSL